MIGDWREGAGDCREGIIEKGDCAVKKKTVAEQRGLTPEELIEKRHVANQLYRNNAFQTAGLEEDENGINANTRYIKKNLEVASLPEIDMTDPEQVRKRIVEYFEIEAKYGNKPTVAGLGMALNGMDRRRLWEIKTGNFGNTKGIVTQLPKSVTDNIKKAYRIMEQLWEDYMQNGKINPVAGIFLGKNNYGYQDKTEYILTPKAGQGNEYSEQEIRERLGLPSPDTE